MITGRGELRSRALIRSAALSESDSWTIREEPWLGTGAVPASIQAPRRRSRRSGGTRASTRDARMMGEKAMVGNRDDLPRAGLDDATVYGVLTTLPARGHCLCPAAMWDGKVIFVVIVAVVLAAGAGRIVAARYRRRLLALMSTAAPPNDLTAGAEPVSLAITAAPPDRRPTASAMQNRLAQRR